MAGIKKEMHFIGAECADLVQKQCAELALLGKAKRAQHSVGSLGTLRFAQPTSLRRYVTASVGCKPFLFFTMRTSTIRSYVFFPTLP